MYELGYVGNMKRYPWCGGSARYAGRQDITVRLHSPTFPHIDTKKTRVAHLHSTTLALVLFLPRPSNRVRNAYVKCGVLIIVASN